MKDLTSLCFRIAGKFAHFRKFYTNSSSLTYFFPPRTTVTGMIASILGRARDSYYEELSGENCRVALTVEKPVRKIIQTVNYLKMTSKNSVTGQEGHTQVPVEFVVPLSGLGSTLEYLAFFSSQNQDLYHELKTNLQKGYLPYGLFLGTSECPASFEYIGESKLEKVEPGNDYICINSVLRKEFIKEQKLDFGTREDVLRYIVDKMPVEFDKNRNNTDNTDFIMEAQAKPISAVVESPVYTFRNNNIERNLVFMEKRK
jgi:CRISPR-associated protein Cas5h